MMDLIINSFLWLIVAYPQLVLFASIIGAVFLGLALFRVLEVLSGKPRFAFVIVVPFFLLFSGGALLGMGQGDSQHEIERVLSKHAPGHPALERLASIRQTNNWRDLMFFRDKWSAPIRHGSELLALNNAARSVDSHIGDEVLRVTQHGAISDAKYRHYTQLLLALGASAGEQVAVTSGASD